MTFIALLRGINVGGNKMVAMADLRTALAEMGFSDVKTLLQSGNVVFTGPTAKPAAIESRLERELAKRLGFSIDIHVRTAAEWTAIVAANPFTAEAKTDPGHLLVTVFREPLDKVRVAAAQKAIPGRERLHADNRQLYAVYPDGVGRSKAPVLIDRALGVQGTARNWNTVMKLAELTASR